jgi:hypothetical protein
MQSMMKDKSEDEPPPEIEYNSSFKSSAVLKESLMEFVQYKQQPIYLRPITPFDLLKEEKVEH